MNTIHQVLAPVGTCQDCYQCVYFCPVKSIRITDHRFAVREEEGHTFHPARGIDYGDQNSVALAEVTGSEK